MNVVRGFKNVRIEYIDAYPDIFNNSLSDIAKQTIFVLFFVLVFDILIVESKIIVFVELTNYFFKLQAAKRFTGREGCGKFKDGFRKPEEK